VGAAVDWLDSLSPWPSGGFGVERMQELLAELGQPQNAFPAIHVVGTNGKSTAAVTIEQLLLGEGLSVGTTISPHVASWSERIRIDGAEADLDELVESVRPPAVEVQATQFEIVTAAALLGFARAEVDVSVVEAGLGGRLDATNVLRTRVVLLTNVGLEHTDVLGSTLEAIAREKLAVAKEGTIVVLPDETWTWLVPGREVRIGGAREAAEAFLDREIEAEVEVVLPGRFEQRQAEVRDGAHNPDGARFLVERLPAGDWTIVASILRDKDADSILRVLRRAGTRLVATRSSSDRALAADELAARARPYFEHVEAVESPVVALERAHELGEPVLVTGSLYLLGDLATAESAAWRE
jgi:dihydrofolate synthase / folylpolyglutamate synthase